MPTTPEVIAAEIAEAATAGFRGRLIARGLARAIIWRDGQLPPDAPAFAPQLSDDLHSNDETHAGHGAPDGHDGAADGRTRAPAKMSSDDRGESLAGFVEALADALDLREHETGLHSRRVACHTLVLARRFTSDAAELHQIYCGALLHDIGKIGVPDRILLKEGPLTSEEWAVMRRHPEDGFRLVSHLPGMPQAAEIVRSHEERYDGKGYPRGLRGEEIPFGARLFAVIDTLDAITSNRSYRPGASFDSAREEILRKERKQFDPIAIGAFLAAEDELRAMVETKCMDPGNNGSIGDRKQFGL